jgi:CopA family copper-resistance protein
MTGRRLSLSRRDAMRLAVAAGSAGVATVYRGRRSFASADQNLTLDVERTRITVDGVKSDAISIGGSVPAPTLRWREGQEIVVHATNRMDQPTSIHWHGLLIQGVMDGAPGFNGYVAIEPGETYTYRFVLRQAGTYWYHSHSALQEQAGMYGAIVIEPLEREPIRYDRDYVAVLSDHTPEEPLRVLRNLKADPEYYNKGKRTLLDFFDDVETQGFDSALQDRLDWGEMRMDPTDMADVTGYAFLINGKGPADNWTWLFEPGERIRLRIINASAMSFFDVRVPGLKMTVVAADGNFVAPVPVDEFRFGVGETYDVILRPEDAGPYTFFAEPIDRSGYARATLAIREGLEGEIPQQRRRAILSMSDMGMAHAGMDHGMMSDSDMAGMDHGDMGGEAMDHSMMDHGDMDMSGMANDDTGQPVGWDQAGTPSDAKALAYEDLRAHKANRDTREPSHEIAVRLTGIMERYIWTLNGEKFDHGDPIRVGYGDRVRLRFINETMMAHPMHLHGMFMELENGESDRKPLKHVIIVPPGKEVTAVLTADEPGEWPFHCHLLYHMASGMMTRFVVEQHVTMLDEEGGEQ